MQHRCPCKNKLRVWIVTQARAGVGSLGRSDESVIYRNSKICREKYGYMIYNLHIIHEIVVKIVQLVSCRLLRMSLLTYTGFIPVLLCFRWGPPLLLPVLQLPPETLHLPDLWLCVLWRDKPLQHACTGPAAGLDGTSCAL